MIVKMADLGKQYMNIRPEIDQAIQEVLLKSAFIKGEYVERFEENFAEYIGAKHCIGVGSCSDALFISLKVLGIGEGDEVITTAYSFVATSEAIVRTGADVVFVDCDKDSFNIDIRLIEDKITEKTKAIIPVHLYGQPVDMISLLGIANDYKLSIIEDCAQAHGAKHHKRNVGTFGEFGCFSFYPGKNLGAYGDGGAIVTNDDRLAQRVRRFADHGRDVKFGHLFIGMNSRLDGIQAAILDVKLKHLDEWTERRRAIAKIYNKGLKGIMKPQTLIPHTNHVYHIYAVKVKDRDKLRTYLTCNGISTGVHYPTPLPFFEAYGDYIPEDFPNANAIKDEMLNLPVHESMGIEEAEHVVKTIKEFYG